MVAQTLFKLYPDEKLDKRVFWDADHESTIGF